MTSSPLPTLSEFLRWIAEMPAAFRAEPATGGKGGVRVRAVVADLLESLGYEPTKEALLKPFDADGVTQAERNRLRWVLAACHLLWHPALRGRDLPRTGVLKLLMEDMAALSAVAPAEALSGDEERREELIRRTLGAAALRLPGESEGEAADRMTQVDSVERRKLLAASVEKQKRAKAIAEEIRRKAAEEAASKPAGE